MGPSIWGGILPDIGQWELSVLTSRGLIDEFGHEETLGIGATTEKRNLRNEIPTLKI